MSTSRSPRANARRAKRHQFLAARCRVPVRWLFSTALCVSIGVMSSVATKQAHANLAAPCAAVPDDSVSALFDAWIAALSAGRVENLTDLYADDAVIMPGTSAAPFRGRAAISEYFGRLLTRHPQATAMARVAQSACNSASEAGFVLYRVTGVRKGTRMLLGGRYKAEFVFQNGAWKIVRHWLAADPRRAGVPANSPTDAQN